MLKLSSIKPNPDNPRIILDHKFIKLVESLKKFPKMMELRPIIIDDNGIVQGGNMRLKALNELGYDEIPDEWVKRAKDFTPEELKEFIIKDNVSFGDWDFDALMLFEDLDKLTEWGVEFPAYKLDSEVEEDNYEIPDHVETDIVIGDRFEIGAHVLICGDSTKEETFVALLEGKKADLVVTDPPYNVAYEGGTKNKLKIKNDNQSSSDFYMFLFQFFNSLINHVKPGGAWYVWHADSEGINFRSAMTNAGITIKQCLIWVKNSMVMGRQDYQWQHEPCLYGWKEGAKHQWYGDRKQTTILNFDRPTVSAEHPTMKPVKLISHQVCNSSKQGDIVVDAFGGSGTTMVACEQLERSAYLVEFDPVYCQVIIDRMKKLNPKLEIKKNGVAVQ